MTFHSPMAGAESVYAFMLGSPSFFTRAEFKRGFRAEIDMEIERLIALADALDGDADLEEDGAAEPSLAFHERHPQCQGYGYSPVGAQSALDLGNCAELEDEHDGREPEDDSEPSLGWTVDGAHSAGWNHNHESEPALGWSGHGSGWQDGRDTRDDGDREGDFADEGEPDVDAEESYTDEDQKGYRIRSVEPPFLLPRSFITAQSLTFANGRTILFEATRA